MPATVVHEAPAAGGAETEAAVEELRLADALTEAMDPQAVCGECRPNRVGGAPGGGGDGVIAEATRLPMPAGGVGDDTLVVPTALAEDAVRPHAPPLQAEATVEEPGALPARIGALLPPGLAATCASAAAAVTAAVLPEVLELKGKTLAVALLQVTA